MQRPPPEILTFLKKLVVASKTQILTSIFFSLATSAQRIEAKIPLAPPPIIAMFFFCVGLLVIEYEFADSGWN